MNSQMKKLLEGWTWPNLLALFFAIFMFVYIAINGTIKRITISTCYKVVPATLIETYYKRTGRFGTIQFVYKDRIVTKDYESINDLDGYEIGKKYFVKISCNNDSLSTVDWETPVPDSLSHSPPYGWSSDLIYSK